MDMHQTRTDPHASPRRPGVALVLSMVSTGVGHVYCGRFGRGLLLLFASMVLGVVFVGAMLPVNPALRIAGVVALIAGLALWLAAMLDARRIARRTPADYARKDYNRWWVYLILMLLPMPASAACALHVRSGLVRAFRIAADHMVPTLRKGDRVLVSKTVYQRVPVQRGDVIAFAHPNRRHRKLIRRVVALPGDTVRIESSQVYVNGRPLAGEPGELIGDDGGGAAMRTAWEINGPARYQIMLRAASATAPHDPNGHGDPPEMIIPDGHCFVLADRRASTPDSRHFGTVPLRDVIGRVVLIYFPRWVRLPTWDER